MGPQAALFGYTVYVLCVKGTAVTAYLVDAATWAASCTVNADGLEWTWIAVAWLPPLYHLVGGHASLPIAAAAHTTAAVPPQACKVLAGGHRDNAVILYLLIAEVKKRHRRLTSSASLLQFTRMASYTTSHALGARKTLWVKLLTS